MDPNASTLKGRYSQLETDRAPFLRRARECSKLTIPSLIPPNGHNASSDLPTPFQGLGARGVNNLASKLLLSILPANTPFFKETIDDYQVEKVAHERGARDEIDLALAKIERTVMTDLEASNLRVSAFTGFKHLIVGGNVLCYLPPEGGQRAFGLHQYVCKRDAVGNMLEAIVHETISPKALPEEVRAACDLEKEFQEGKSVDVYTGIKLVDGKHVVHQEIKGRKVPGSDGSYPADRSAWVAVRMIAIDGEDYGRSYIEEYLGDLKSLEALTRAIVEGSAAAAKVLFLVNPNGTTNQSTISKAPNGAVRPGNEADVSVLQLQKFNDFRVALETIHMIQERLSYAFLLNSSVQRKGERVTAEEIRYMAGELDDALGGIYTLLSSDYQLPLVKRTIHRLERKGRLPSLPKGLVRPAITTGLQALGRGHDLNKLQAFLQALAPLGPETVSTRLNVDDYINRVATSVGIDPEGLIKDGQTTGNENMQQMILQVMQKALPGMLQEYMKQQGQQPAPPK